MKRKEGTLELTPELCTDVTIGLFEEAARLNLSKPEYLVAAQFVIGEIFKDMGMKTEINLVEGES